MAFLMATTAWLGMPVAPAAAQTWTGVVNSDWGTAGNWDNNAVPNAASAVSIDGTAANAPVIGGALIVDALSINVGGFVAPASLSIAGNGVLTTTNPSFLGFAPGEEGIVTLDGASLWTSTNVVLIGHQGVGWLYVTDGSVADHNESAYLGLDLSLGGGSQGFAIVDGAGSQWNVGEILVVGGSGQGNLQVTDGGLVSSNEAYIGGLAGSEGIATLTGSSTWNNATGLYIGYEGQGILRVFTGSDVVSGLAAIGAAEGAFGHALVVGAGSTWTVNDDIFVGFSGEGLLGMGDDGHVDVAGDAWLGIMQTGQAEVTIEGGGIWSVAGAVYAGIEGAATINVETGGTMSSTGALIGMAESASGSVVVSGPGSGWNNAGLIQIGVFGHGELTISDGAGVSNTEAGIGVGGGSSGVVNVDDATWINAGDLLVGHFGHGTLSISNGATVSNWRAYVGNQTGGTGIVVVEGQGSQWLVDQDLFVGGAGEGTLAIHDGATVVSAANGGGTEIGSGGGTGGVGISGAGSDWTNHGFLLVGAGGMSMGEGHGSVEVADGGHFTNNGVAYLGFQAGSTGNASISGGTWNNNGDLYVGYEGDGVLSIDDGLVTSANAVVGAVAGSAGAVTANGNGIVWSNAGSLTIGEYGTAELSIGENAIVFAQGSVTAAAQPGASAEVVVDGVLVGLGGVTFNSSSHLGGTGIVTAGLAGTTTMNGTIAPGNSIGTLTVVGNYVQNAGSTYEVEIDAASNSDLIYVSGTATLNGGEVVVEPSSEYTVGTTYTILSAAGGLTGEFEPLNSSYSYFLSPELSYDANNAYLTVQQTASFESAAITPNQIATAQGADSLPTSNEVWSAISLLQDVETAQQAFDRLSGEVHGSVQSALIEDSRFLREAAVGRIRAAFRDASVSTLPVMAYGEGAPESGGPDTDRPALWGYGFGSWGHRDSDGNAARMDGSIGGALLGADLAVADLAVADWRLGALAGYSRSSVDLDARASSANIESWHLGIYGGAERGNLAFRTGAAYSWHEVTSARTAAFPGFADSPGASYGAGTGQVFGELAYALDLDAYRFEPLANLAYVHQRRPGFSEQGGAAALTASPASTDTTFATLGLRGTTGVDLGAMAMTMHAMLGWRHAFGDVTPTSTHTFSDGAPFTVAGAAIARDAAVIEAGLDLRFSPQTSFGLSYSGQIAGDGQSHGFAARLGVGF